MDFQAGKSGYLDIKFQSRAKGLSRKGWKRRWIVMQPLTDHCECKIVIRLQVFPNAESWNSRRQLQRNNITTVYLDNVTDIRRIVTSKSHSYAFQVIEFEEYEEPLVLLAGENESTSQSWITYLRAAFWQNTTINLNAMHYADRGIFLVTAIDNEHSKRLDFFGDYLLHVTSESLTLLSAPDGATKYEWKMKSLRRFAIIETECEADINRLFIIVAGPSAVKGEGSFSFFTFDAGKVLHYIHETINAALASKAEEPRPRLGKTETSVIPTVPPRYERRKLSTPSLPSEPRDTPRHGYVHPRQHSLPAVLEPFNSEEIDRDGTLKAGRDGISLQSVSSSNNSSRFVHCGSESTLSCTPSPLTQRHQWKAHFPTAMGGTMNDSDKNHRPISVSSTGSRDSGFVQESTSEFPSRTYTWMEDTCQPINNRLFDITETDSKQGSQSSISVEHHEISNVSSNDAEIGRSQSFNHLHQKNRDLSTSENRRFTYSHPSELPRGNRMKKISDIYIDLDAILAAKAELDLKLEKVEETRVTPLPPLPPKIKSLSKRSVKHDDSTLDDNDILYHNQFMERKLDRSRKSSRSRKLSNTSNIYFEVGSLSDISKACANSAIPENSSSELNDGESGQTRDRTKSNLYLDLDTVAILRTESYRSHLNNMNSLTPPEPPPRKPSPRPKQKYRHRNCYEEVDLHRKNLAQILGTSAYPINAVPPELPERPANLRPSKKTAEPTVFASIFGSLTRRKKRQSSTESQSSSIVSSPSLRKVKSISDWPLPSPDCRVADNELYGHSMEDEFDCMGSIPEDVFKDNDEMSPPFQSLISPINKSWLHTDGDKNNCEENYYMAMNGHQQLTSVSSNSSETSLNTTNTSSGSFKLETCNNDKTFATHDIIIKSENPYLVMSDAEVVDNKAKGSFEESGLYMNIGDICNSSEA